MKCVLASLVAVSTLSFSCKPQSGDSTPSGIGGEFSAETSEQCGVVELQNQVFYLRPDSGQNPRIVDPQDGASSNILKDAVASKTPVCIRGRWSGKDPVMISSASAIRNNSNSASAKEECGTIFMKQNEIVFQVSGDNSENNNDHVLEPQDGAVANVLQDLAMKMAQACIAADFSKPGQPVMIKSASVVRAIK